MSGGIAILTAPTRIQRRRMTGWRMPEGAVYVGRPSRWGNRERDLATFEAKTRDFVGYGPHGDVEDWLAPLRGHDLVCWCPLDQPCHADVLLKLANR